MKNCATFTDCISEIDKIQVDNTEDLDVVILTKNWNIVITIQKSSRTLGQYCRNEPNNILTDSESFEFKLKTSSNTTNLGTSVVEVTVPFKHFRITLEMLLISF